MCGDGEEDDGGGEHGEAGEKAQELDAQQAHRHAKPGGLKEFGSRLRFREGVDIGCVNHALIFALPTCKPTAK